MKVKTAYFDTARNNNFIPLDFSPNKNISLAKIRYKLNTFHYYCICNALIDIGGYQFGDPWGITHAKNIARSSTYASLLKCKRIYMPQAWGPFNDPEFIDCIPPILKKSMLYYVRDEFSYKSLKQIYPVTPDRLRPDIAWCFDTGNIDVDKILAAHRIDITKSIVCMTPNLRVFEKYGTGYLDLFTDIIQILLKNNYQVILLGHELRINDEQDDRYLCRKLKTNNPDVIHIDSFLSAKQIKRIISYCDFIVSSRYHALIAALSQQIPVVAVGWSHKYEELLRDVGLSSNILDPGKPIAHDFLSVFFNNIKEKREKQKTILGNTVPAIIKRSEATLEEVLNTLRN